MPGEPTTIAPVHHFAVVVIGGGTAGVAAALECAALGSRTAIVECAQSRLGGRIATGGRAWLAHLDYTSRALIPAEANSSPVQVESAVHFDENLYGQLWRTHRERVATRFRQKLQSAGIKIYHQRAFISAPGRVILLDPISGDERGELTADHIMLTIGSPLPESLATGSPIPLDSALDQLAESCSLPDGTTLVQTDLQSLCAQSIITRTGSPGFHLPTRVPPNNHFSHSLLETISTFLAQHQLSAPKELNVQFSEAILAALHPADQPDRPPNTNLSSSLIGLRKLGIRCQVDGRISGNPPGPIHPLGDPQLRIWAAGSCVAGTSFPPSLTSHYSSLHGLLTARAVHGHPVRFPTPILRQSGWIGSTYCALAASPRWTTYIHTGPTYHMTTPNGLSRLLLLAGSHHGEIALALALGPQADSLIQVCQESIQNELTHNEWKLLPGLSALIPA